MIKLILNIFATIQNGKAIYPPKPIIKLGFMDNDRAPVSMIEFVDFASEQLQKEPENVKKD